MTMPSNQRIEDYALISDCATAALVGRNGSIDWLCLPRFDSAACFAALLGEPEHGRWLIAPAEPEVRVERRYMDGSLILVTLFETLEDNLRFLNVSLLLTDIATIVDEVDAQLAQSMDSYMNARQQATAA